MRRKVESPLIVARTERGDHKVDLHGTHIVNCRAQISNCILNIESSQEILCADDNCAIGEVWLPYPKQ